MQATNTNPNIEASGLSLGPITNHEVPDATPHYRQHILYKDAKLRLLTPNFQAEGLKIKEHGPNNRSLLVPVAPWLRSQFDVVESFARENVNFPSKFLPSGERTVYKPLYRGDMMYIQISNWCQMFRQAPTSNQCDAINIDTPLGRGTYNVTIEVPYAYIGPHKNGENFSLNLRVIQIYYMPEELPAAISTKTSKAKGRRRKNAGEDQEAS